MDAAPLQPQLPALGIVDAGKTKREEEAYQSRNPSGTSTIPPSAASTEQAYSYTRASPTTYSHAAPAPILATSAAAELGTPPDSRRASGEKCAATQPAKQSLPSISEALGVDNQTKYQTPLSTQAPPLLPLQAPLHKSLVPSSPVPAMREYAADPPQPHAEAYGPSYARSSTPKYQPSSEGVRSLFPDVRPALHLSTAAQPPYPPGPGSTSYTHTTTSSSPVYERSQGSSTASFTYGYTPYPPRYQSSTSSGPIYQPSSVTTAPSWKSEPSSRHQERSYGESVKRHLDLYDLESGLNDITSTSSFLGDFAHRYSNLLHQSPRSGPQLSMLPGIIEIEDMISKSRAQTEALLKIRETVLAQQAAHDQEAAEQRQQKSYGAEMAPPHSSGDSDDGKSAYSGSDSKKRRGRAAPPGRCHSCNRAETPEWRRGPDGARTLCNACGLHYAKLTRKQNTAGKPGAINSSNLRPKEHLP